MEHILTSPVISIMDRLSSAGHEARVAGGAVRDVLRGRKPKDIDLATTATPDVMMELFTTDGWNAIPTGIQHGTITVVVDGEPYEVTTLRIDATTDGRHAEVVFTDDWELDAARRDFTMNAMFMDRNGTVHDYFDGQKDLLNGLIRFVGDPDVRIEEDYLRILRYYRFKMTMGGIDHAWKYREGNEAIREHVHGLRQISGERIWMELSRILGGYNDGHVVLPEMEQNGVMAAIGLDGFSYLNLHHVRKMTCPITRLLRAMPHRTFQALDVLANRYNVSAEEHKLARFLCHNQLPGTMWRDRLTHYQNLGLEQGVPNHYLAGLAFLNLDGHHIDTLMEWDRPEFPLRGQDLLDAGLKPGPEVGRQLSVLKKIWIADTLDPWMTAPNKEQLLAKHKTLFT